LKDDIKKFQSDKLQLSASIANFKKNYSHLKDFQELFEITSKLRKEQEEDSNLDKRLAKQHYDLEDNEDRLLVAKQRLIDLKKNLNDNVSAFELLESLRNQRNANREIYENLSKYELQDKKMKLKSLEEILVLPDISFEEISKLKKDKLNLHNEIEKLENKVKNSALKSSELTIYNQNAIQAANNKESAMKILEKLEKEKTLLDHKYQDLDRKFEITKGYKFVRKDDILQQAENVKKKKEIYLNYNKTLDGIKGDSLILERTINLVKYKTEDGESIIKSIEEKNGISSLNIQRKELEELSRKKQEIDVSKALTLEEYSKLIQQVRQKIQETQEKHAPVIDEHAKIKAEYEKILPTFNKKKVSYENAISDEQNQYNKVKEQFDKLEVEFRNCQNKFHQMNVTSKITEEMIRRYEAESQYLAKPDKKLNDKFKSYSDYYKAITVEQEELVKNLKERQKQIKGTYEENLRQVIYFIIFYSLFKF
jgi:hypothetical protein